MRFIQLFIFIMTFIITTTNSVFSQNNRIDTNRDSLKTFTIKVKGISCSMDLSMISANVEKLQGVIRCKPLKQGPTSTFEITYNPSKVSENEIFLAIENTASCENPDERPYKVKQ
ncbi:MAG: hypothetical protein N2167_03475 [Flavobacteriales bacterium]|nr:hypothetical protein [Flavobacteriales bacterium]